MIYVGVYLLFFIFQIQAHYKKTLYVSLYSDNEIVVKVASGQYQAKACKEIFDKIQRHMTDDNDFLRVIYCLTSSYNYFRLVFPIWMQI